MPWPAYIVKNGAMLRGTAPDGCHMGIGATMYNGRDLARIVAIDYEAGLYRRDRQNWEPFPERWYYSAAINWESADAMGKS